MPKKITTNPKALEARARKEEKKRTEQEKIQKAKEDALWTDDDKHVNRKLQRKEDRDRKKQEEQEKKLINKQLYEEEMSSIKSAAKAPSQKVTRTQIANLLESKKTTGNARKKSDSESSLEENPNISAVEEVSASNIDEALSVLGVKDEPLIDKHPEKRMKAAYSAYEEARLKQMKIESPTLRLSQMKQIIRKDWLKAPENPLNQAKRAVDALKG